MAKELNMQFRGRIGPLVGCLRDGKYYYRSRPEKVSQTKATKASSNMFALASRAGKIMRLYLQHSIPNPKDILMQRQLVGRIRNWLQLSGAQLPQPVADIPFVNHFNFNPARPLQEAMRLSITFVQTGTNLTQLQIPAFVPALALKVPAHTVQIELCISAVAWQMQNQTGIASEQYSITIPYNQAMHPAQQVTIPLPTGAGNILIAALQLRFVLEGAGQPVYAKANLSPAAIVGAIYV